MDNNITQERTIEGPILKVNKQEIWNTTQVEKSMVFETLKNKQCIMTRNKIISGKLHLVVKNSALPKIQGLIIQKLVSIYIKYLVYGQSLHF